MSKKLIAFITTVVVMLAVASPPSHSTAHKCKNERIVLACHVSQPWG